MTNFYLGNIETKRPKYTLHQDDTLKWLVNAHSLNKTEKEKALNEKKILRFSCLSDKIQFRHSELYDYMHDDWSKMEIFKKENTLFDVPLETRMSSYKRAVEQIFDDFYNAYHDEPPKHLIHVTCTGYASPSAAQKYVSKKNWPTTVTHCYHMGCYAAFPAVRMGRGFLSADCQLNETVDIVHTELCSLHFNLTIHTIDQHVVQSLFADGYAKYTLSQNTEKFKNSYFALLAMHESIIPETEGAMTWDVAHSSFLMTISKSVPDVILKNIKIFLTDLISKTNEKIDIEKCIFAIHPGGPKIISAVQAALSLEESQIEHSIQVLRNHGNMSSATLPHVWELILNENTKNYDHVISFAFGPGLTVSGSIMKICH